MKDPIHKLFHVWQGHQITDEEIYNLGKGQHPILTGHNVIKGYTQTPYITDVPCITIPSKGIVNELYLQARPFDANNTIALIPKDRKKIDLEYFLFTQSEYLTSFISSTNTNNYLNKAILNNVEIEYPDYPIQVKIRDQYKNLIAMKEMIENDVEKLSEQLDKNIRLTGREKILDDVFTLIVGSDDEMTEKYAYNNKGDIPIYSGASNNDGILRYTNRADYNPSDEYITWSLSGKAGTLYLRKGACCLTRDCGIMIPKNKNEINLRWFILTQEKGLREFSIGKGGLGRLKKILIKLYPFTLPSKDVQNGILEEFEKLIMLKNRLDTVNSKIDILLKNVRYSNSVSFTN